MAVASRLERQAADRDLPLLRADDVLDILRRPDLRRDGSEVPMDPPGDDPGGDPGEEPYLRDINNSWESIDSDPSFLLQTTSHFGASSSGVIRGTVSTPTFEAVNQVDGVYYNRMIHFTAMLGSTIMTLDGMFVDAGTMHLTIRESQAQIILICRRSGVPCFP
jgi:hypothetical protein